MITFKRADEGMPPEESRYVMGRIAKSNISMNDPFDLGHGDLEVEYEDSCLSFHS